MSSVTFKYLGHATFPPLIGTPEQLRELTKDLGTEVIALKPGETGSQ